MKTYLIIPAIFLALLNAQGSLYSFSYTGQVGKIYQNENNTLGIINEGDLFSGTFSYSDVPDSNPSVERGDYSQQASFSLTLGTNQIDYNGYTVIRVRNDVSTNDEFDLDCADSFDDWNLMWFGLQFADTSQSAFIDDSLPTSFEISDFNYPIFRFDGSRISTGDQFYMEMSVLNISPIPEPSILSMLGLAAGIIWIRKRPKGSVRLIRYSEKS